MATCSSTSSSLRAVWRSPTSSSSAARSCTFSARRFRCFRSRTCLRASSSRSTSIASTSRRCCRSRGRCASRSTGRRCANAPAGRRLRARSSRSSRGSTSPRLPAVAAPRCGWSHRTRSSDRVGLTVAVTGPTGTFGFGLMPLLEADERVERVVGIARRTFDPAAHGWTKLAYRQGDVRDRAALERAFEEADVVVHLAFMVTGAGAGRETIRAINVDGTLNAFAAAAAAGARRFVYPSSVAAYGFHRDNPIGMTEEWPVGGAAHLFYAQEKAEIEQHLAGHALLHPDLELYLLRPPIVLGPHSVGAKMLLPGPLEPLGRALAAATERLPVALPAIVPPLPLQFVHEEDVGEALMRCIAGAGPPGAYNIAGD